MKNHFIGLLIFSFIVSVSAVIAFWFAPLPQIAPVESFDAPPAPKVKNRDRWEKLHDDTAEVKITQAILDEQTRRLVADFAIHRVDREMENVNIVLHFFIKNGSRTKYLTSQNIWIKPVFNNEDDGTLRFSLVNKLFDTLADDENLYVIPEIGYRNSSVKGDTPAFDADKAVAVTNEKYSYKFAAQ